jgi:GGDEF domain-containing protein
MWIIQTVQRPLRPSYGDDCSQNVAQALADLVARYDGEDFVMRLPQTPRRGVEHIARRALDTVDGLDNRHQASLTVRLLTVSTGIASYDDTTTPARAGANRSAEFPFADNLRVGGSARGLVRATDNALHAANDTRRTQARKLDIADVDAPRPVRDIVPSSREPLADRPRDPSDWCSF